MAEDLPASEFELVGYFPKTTKIPEGYLLPEHVKEICTVSTCINAPEGWIEHWLHNDLGFYNTRATAKAILPSDASNFSLFAYRMLPVRFEKNHEERITIPPLAAEPVDQTFISIGFDAISKSGSSFFECSPLSCNYLAKEVPVNGFCLVATLEEAIALAKRCALGGAEPGPYYVFEVLRRKPPF